MPKVHKKVDVVTIGAGWTSSVIGWKLGAAGHSVVALEIGEARWANPDFMHNHDPLRHEIRKALMYDISQETWTWRPNAGLPSLPIRQYGSFHPGRGLGGASVHWTAQFWRFLPADFQHRSHNIARYGQNKIPADMTVQDWPVTYDELEPYYDRVEYDIGASGAAGNLAGQIVPGGNPFEAPRSRPYPLPPHPMMIHAQMFADACNGLGYHPFPQPAGILSQAYRDVSGRVRSGCIYCGYCTRYGCEVDAKTSAVSTHIPAALQTGNYEVRTYCKVRRINVGPDGMATGVTYVDLLTGQEHEQPAEVVLVSSYTLSNVRLLLLSQSAKHPRGVGNDRNMVGKNYTYQLSKTPTTLVFEGHRFNEFAGNGVVQSLIYDFNADNFDHSNVDFIGGASIYTGSGQRDPLTSVTTLPPQGTGRRSGSGAAGSGSQAGAGTQQGGGAGQESGPPKDGQIATAGDVGSVAGRGTEWGRDWKENLRRNWDSTVGIGVQGEIQAYRQNFLDLDPTYKDSFGDPLLRLTFDFYDNERNMYRFLAQKCDQIGRAMNPTRMKTTPELDPYNIYQYQSTHCTGGAIMGRDPGSSVTNKYGQVWDTPNVFVTGAALYPQNPGANPTETLLALAYMAADAIRDRYFRNPGELLV
ncbi:GMC family oxidoreductase (plasmid) [Deinococcus metallilatus]|uniref:GMC family oxidoreductase n=1 Tax=Deinococcus metallilatus TaxID=1211322 RepID=A0AAJ5FC13_9DEIO|nr:GMC family oxidoreductase [Deinococcus metallilatus]MBB5293337.1 gluconate 2-dehydrogenase alpha chain [Deinococcus metallilatus]QBY06443.1 GMC family oxidoreductase [Deinococcus metallilatus]RXJ18122.1 GMC family oxidoreductase [Deinococcus metallilatus]TLK32058.1 GMC family oxidoreductase [Deinococcus metallilatus]GMA15440.1 GMC family oxidoreductase [Deinococcus metallilatus]